ncbi:MAG: hypothetical protein OEV85_02235 [Candidatus Thorarchaeota archaeon]|nr:hypothetical protein [Candidatus Thorarchaeota archaeon]
MPRYRAALQPQLLRWLVQNHDRLQKIDEEGQLLLTDCVGLRSERVKPLGTITICFPHVDEETRIILQSVIDEAEDFGDFAERLCERVCSESSPPLLEYLIAQFSYWIEYHALIDRLVSAGKVSDLALPLLLLVRESRGEAISWDDMKKSVKQALMAAPNDWIAAHLYLTWRLIAEYAYPESDTDIRPIEAVISSVEKNTDLECLKPYLLWLKAHRFEIENKSKEALKQWRQALAIARKFDDQVMVADIIRMIAEHIRQTDVKQAIDLYTSTREISVKIGYKCGIGKVQRSLGLILQSRGELDGAIEYISNWRKIGESIGRVTKYDDCLIACMYNQMREGQKAFEIAETVVDFYVNTSGLRYLSRAHVELAWALINLGRYDEAEAELATAHAIATKSGASSQMIWVELVEAILEKAEGNFDSAIAVFKEILEDLENNPVPVLQHICLLSLTEIEIEMLTGKFLEKNFDSSGPWMTKLVEYAEKNDLPGIVAQALLLKAKLRRKQGRFDEVRKILREVQKTTKRPSMMYLNDLAISMFPDIIVT